MNIETAHHRAVLFKEEAMGNTWLQKGQYRINRHQKYGNGNNMADNLFIHCTHLVLFENIKHKKI